MKLNAPTTSGSISVSGTTYEIKDGIVDIVDAYHAQQLIESHGFTEWKPGQAAPVDETSELDEDATDAEVMLKSLPALPRPFMQRTLKELGVVYPQSAKNDDLRAMLKEQIEARIEREKQPGQKPQPIALADDAAKIAEAAAAAEKAKLEDEQRARNNGLTDAEVQTEVARLTTAGWTPEDIEAARAGGQQGFAKKAE